MHTYMYIILHVDICDRECKNLPYAAKFVTTFFIPLGSVKYAGHADIFLNFIGQSA